MTLRFRGTRGLQDRVIAFGPTLPFCVQAVTMDLSLLSGTTRLSPGLRVTVP